MIKNFKTFFLLATLVFCQNLFSQEKPKDSAAVKTDTAKVKKDDKKKSLIKPYKEIITDKAVSDQGVFTVHKVDDKYYFEIPDAMLKKEFLLVTRLTKAAAGMRTGTSGYAGDQIGQQVIAFEKGPKDKILLRSISHVDYAKDSTSDMYNSVTRNNVQSIIKAFDVKAYGVKKNSTVIEVTDVLNSDNELTAFSVWSKDSYRVGAFQKDMSFVNFVKSFPTNIEINTTKTFARTLGTPATPAIPGRPAPKVSGNYTVEINSSFVLLPENKMQSRYFDPRVGYFTVGYTDFDLDPQGVKKVSLVKRWRLEPKTQDIEKYNRGELVEPAKPIVFYIDPATPKKWVPYLIQGVNDWQKAFEKAGFKNAIVAKVPDPKVDTEWSLEDARFSAIVYKPSDVPNASGPSIADPRTGEILESHINWYHNVMMLLRNWYFVQAAPNDPRARKIEFEDKLMGELIRFVSSHEVGHTLGLRHNYGSSSTVPVEKLRDKKWLEKNGHTPSIMDYARFNYVAQPEDNIGDAGIFPRIGDYDDWAIEWGYKRFNQFKTPDAEKEFLNQWVIKNLKNERLWFGTESNPLDPRSQSEQVGDNAMIASTYGIKNLQRIVDNLEKWTKTPNEDYANLDMMYDQVTGQFRRYLGHVSKYIGGQMETPKTAEQSGAVYEVVAKKDQKEAMKFLDENVFTTPQWLIKKDIFEKTGKTPVKTVEEIQNGVLGRILSPMVLQNMYQMEAIEPDTYSVIELLSDLNTSILKKDNVDIYTRNLQRNYIDSLIKLVDNKSDKSDVSALVRGNLNTIKKELSAKSASDVVNKYHNEDLVFRIEKALDPK
ncbi:zinc-dependent metalloprotease [Chryseobacterium aquaticum]|uniref:Zinc-dependent metalloprotease n=1 Tax=Chryseobacterium aquaticum TaxID=452084 RepID=A0A848N2U3_9FLAO|nr:MULTISPECIES: zinc-dependent metalloprotease [Chryseobacterium]NMR35447.1 zinc-dependent metalloprotease [Chryseobacterium aquaticum]NRQ47523.1 zinc-dependent metalloprotease [Chryseobacterium sp. C-204]